MGRRRAVQNISTVRQLSRSSEGVFCYENRVRRIMKFWGDIDESKKVVTRFLESVLHQIFWHWVKGWVADKCHFFRCTKLVFFSKFNWCYQPGAIFFRKKTEVSHCWNTIFVCPTQNWQILLWFGCWVCLSAREKKRIDTKVNSSAGEPCLAVLPYFTICKYPL